MTASLDEFLASDAKGGRVALAARVALARCSPHLPCHAYLRALDEALEQEPPPFDTAHYADIYRTASVEWEWMAVSLIANAEREGDGAKRLWSLAACCPDESVRPQLQTHAIDESRHARLYLSLLDITFPGRVSPAFRLELNALSPGFSARTALVPVPGSPYAKAPSLDDFVQMNIAEIRTAIHHIMQRPALAQHCGSERHKRILSIQDSLLRDELKHIAYTAVLIERIAEAAPFGAVGALFRSRMRDFNRITVDELGLGTFDCSVACCTRHGTCRPRAVEPSGGIALTMIQ